MHYTSIENIHKVIDPLFLDELKAELDEICENPIERTKNAKTAGFSAQAGLVEIFRPRVRQRQLFDRNISKSAAAGK